MIKSRKLTAFPDTNWSTLRRAGDRVDDVREKAVQDVLTAYYPIMIAHLMRRFRLPRDMAQDLVHEFITEKILIKSVLSKADSNVGRFRSYLAHVLGNFVISELRRQDLRRKGQIDIVGVDDLPDPSQAHELSFDEDWARHILNCSVAAMDADCANSGRAKVWHIFKLRILDPMFCDTTPMPYNDLVKELKLRSPRQAMNLLGTAKRVFERHVRRALTAYAVEPLEVEQAFADLRQILLK